MALGGILGAVGGAGAVGRAVVEIVGDSSKLQSDLNKAKATTATATTQMGAKTSKLSSLAVGAYAVAGGAIIGFVGKAIKAASDLGESINKVNVIFGDSAKAIHEFAETSAEIGIAKAEALTAAAGFGAMAQSAGLTEEASAKLSISLVTLAADMGSFNDQDPSEMLIRLRAGLAGEAEPLRRFGVFIDEARVKTEAYASGIAKAGEELDAGQKVQARFNIIMQDTAKQQGDFARTVGESLPNQLRKLSATFTNVAATIGSTILPILVEVTKVVTALLPVIPPITIALVALAGAFLLVKAAAGISTLLVAVGAALQGFTVLTGLGAAVGSFGIALSSLATGPLALIAGSLVSLTLIITNFKAAFEGVGQSVADALPPEFYSALTAAATGTTDLTAKTTGLAEAHDKAAAAASAQSAAELALAGGFVGVSAAVGAATDAENDLIAAQAEVNRLAKEGKTGTDEYKTALANLDGAAQRSLQSQVSLAGAVQKYAEEAANGKTTEAEAINRVRDFGTKAGLTAVQIQTLIGRVKDAVREYGNVPKSINTDVKLNNSAAMTRLRELQDRYRAIKSEIEGTINIAVKPPRAVSPGGQIGPVALGGIIAGQAGFITRGPTMLVGESRKMTFAGRGAEAVIPFDQRGIGILAKALAMAIGRSSPARGGGGRTVIQPVNFDGATFIGDRDIPHLIAMGLGQLRRRYQSS